MMKKTAAVLLAGLIACVLCACGSSQDANLGLYIGTIVRVVEKDEDMSGLYSGENSIELRTGGSAVFTIEDNPMESTYVISDGRITLTHDGVEASGTIEDGVITITDFFGIGITMIFEKE